MIFESQLHYFNTVKKALKNRELILLNDGLEKLKETTDLIYDMTIAFRYDYDRWELRPPTDAFLLTLRESENLDNMDDLDRCLRESDDYLGAIIQMNKDENFDPNNYKDIYLKYHKPSPSLTLPKTGTNALNKRRIGELLDVIRRNDYVMRKLTERFDDKPQNEMDVCQINRASMVDILANELYLPRFDFLDDTVQRYLEDKPFTYDTSTNDEPIVVDDFLDMIIEDYQSNVESAQSAEITEVTGSSESSDATETSD